MLDIFKKEKINSEDKKIKIIADYREKNSLVIAELCELGFQVEFEQLEVSDFLINEIAIERKTVSDFLNSMINKRLARQLDSLRQYEKCLLLIEGIGEEELYNDRKEGINGNAIRGFLLSITLEYNVPIIFTKNSEDTAKFLAVLAKKEEKEHFSLRAKRKTMSKSEQLQFILEGFPGIGPANAKKLLEKFSTIRNIVNSGQDELEQVIGKKAEVFKLLDEKY